jgi:hypothetical protein
MAGKMTDRRQMTTGIRHVGSVGRFSKEALKGGRSQNQYVGPK